jgi:RNA polymerase-associated protein RTF1
VGDAKHRYGEDLFKDEEDKEQLEAMTEIEREMELFERAERRDELIRTMKLRQEQKERQEAAKPAASKPAARERRPAKEDKVRHRQCTACFPCVCPAMLVG